MDASVEDLAMISTNCNNKDKSVKLLSWGTLSDQMNKEGKKEKKV